MAKITISLPDPLKDRLYKYAEEHQVPISQAAQKALEAFLAAPAPAPPPQPVPPPPPPTPGPPANLELFRRISNLERYVSTLGERHDELRNCVGLLGISVDPEGSTSSTLPDELPAPPWQH